MIEFSRTVQPNAEALLANLRREGTPQRVHYMELFLDAEIQEAICQRFELAEGLGADEAYFAEKRQIALQRFLGYDFVHARLELPMPLFRQQVEDTAALARAGGRSFQDEHHGPIMSWEDFEKYPWPDPATASARSLEWYEKNLPDDMCVIGNTGAHFCEHLSWLMGYETLCFALYDRSPDGNTMPPGARSQRDLVRAIYEKVLEITTGTIRRLAEFKRIEAVWGSDDMGFKTATLISPDDMREFVLAGHKRAAEMAHRAGWVYMLHSCGNLREILLDLLDDVEIDAKHSFEDTIELVTDAKREYGDRCALLGGIDVDFLCRADEPAVRERVRRTLEVCLPGGGYCLGSGNSVANYVPLDNYLAMLDEGRRFAS